MKKKLVLIFIVAFIIRMISLNQSLWLDEGTTARVVRQYNFSQIVTQFSPHDFHPPLYYLVLKAWTNIFSYSEVVLRFSSIVFSLVAGWFVYLIGKRLKNEELGIWAAIFFLFNPLIVYYSQEARMYMMTTFLLTAELYYFLLILTGPAGSFPPVSARSNVPLRAAGSPSTSATRQLNLLLFNFFIFLSFITFYGSIFLIFSFYLYLIFKKRFQMFLYLLPGFLLGLILVSPLLYQQFINARTTLKLVANWSLVLGKANLKNLFLIPIKFSMGRISFNPKILYWGVSGVWGIWIFWGVIRAGLKYKFLLYLFIGPLIIGLFASFFTPLLQYFRFLYLIPIMSILLASAVYKLWQKAILAAGFIILTFTYLLFAQFHREDWKNLAKNIPASTVYMIKSSSDPLSYYRNDLIIEDIRNLARIAMMEKTIVIVPYTTEIYGYDYKNILNKLGYEMRSKTSFRGVFYEVWQKVNSSVRKIPKFSHANYRLYSC